MYKYLIVSCGAAVGGACRYWMSSLIYLFLPSYFPFGTLAVNILGSFILGIIIFYFDDHGLINQYLKLFLTVGFCGGFTTFSTFSLETVNLIKTSEFLFALVNVFLNLFLCIAGVYLAYIISR